MHKGRTKLVGVKITPDESSALDWRAAQLRASGRRGATRSTILYEMAQRGNLRSLVVSYLAAQSSEMTTDAQSSDDNGGAS
jgi:hypothetical protein